MAYPTAVALLSSAARTAAGTGDPVDLGTNNGVKFHLDVIAVSGTATPTLTVTIETSRDLIAWSTLDQFTAATATGSTQLAVIAQRYVRAKWTLAGTTPSFTFSIAGEAVQVYATPSDLADFGLSSEVLASVDASRIARILIGCSISAGADLQSSGRIELPLASWGIDLTMAVAKIAAWEIMSVVIGHNPDDPNNFVWRDRGKEGREWLESVVRGLRSPVGIVDATPTQEDSGAEIYTEPQRGW